jgi:hypothetical protein
MAHLLCAFILVLCLTLPAFAAKKRSSHKKKSSTWKNYSVSDSYLVNEMLKHLGVQYRRGGSSRHGLDCSGYVGLVYRNAYGLELPHQSGSLYISSSLQKVPLDELKTGDLLFFTSSKKSKRVNHVGIYLSEGRFVHAASSKGVIVSGLDEQYYSQRIVGARRVLERPSFEEGAFAEPVSVTALSTGLGALPDVQQRSWDMTTMSHSVGLELGKERSFHLSLFQDLLLSPTMETDVNSPLHTESVGLEGRPTSTTVQGVRLEKDLRPFPWLVVTPSFCYFNYEGDLDDTGLPRRSVGVDLSLGSVEDGWTLSTGFRYLSLIAPRGFPEENRAPGGFDMSLTYSKRLSEVLSFSLIGERLQRYDTRVSDLPQERTYEDQRLSILFSFSY